MRRKFLDLVLAAPLALLLGLAIQPPQQIAGNGSVALASERALRIDGTEDGAYSLTALRLVSKVVPDAELLDAARAYAARIAANPPQAVRMTKRLLWEARQASLETVLQLSAAMQALAHTTSDNKEAMKAFVEKRPPQFKGQ